MDNIYESWLCSPVENMTLNGLYGKCPNEYKIEYHKIPNSFTATFTPRSITIRPIIKKVIFSGPCTIVLWANGDKTIVKRSEGDRNDREVAVLYAIAKKKFGNITRVHKKIDPFAKTNAQRIAILRYIVAEDGFDVEKLVKEAQTF